MNNNATITADALRIQERDEFRSHGWLKVIAPAKINLFLAIGEKREDGYHNVQNIMHSLALHDILYMRPAKECDRVTMTSNSNLEVPIICEEDNLVIKALKKLREFSNLKSAASPIDIRIEKNIPAQGGLAGGSADAAAALVGAAKLWGLPAENPEVEQAARTLGADVAFFLKGGCALFDGAGENFARSLEPSKQAVVLVKPEGGVNTAAAYKTFDAAPIPIPSQIIQQMDNSLTAQQVPLFNNLAPAAETIMPKLATVRLWLESQPGVSAAMLCGSGATTFGLCDNFATATAVCAQAKKEGWWARATSLCNLNAACAR